MLAYPFYAVDFTRRGALSPWVLQNGVQRESRGLYFPPSAATTPRAEMLAPYIPERMEMRQYPLTYLAVVVRYGTFSTNDSVLLALRTNAYGPTTNTAGMLMRASDGFVYFNDPGAAGSYGSAGVPADGRPHVVTQVLTNFNTYGFVDTTSIYTRSLTRPAIPWPRAANDRWVVGQANQSGQLGHAILAVALIQGALTESDREALSRDWRRQLFPVRQTPSLRMGIPLYSSLAVSLNARLG